jgi:hypothetical protein
MKSFKFFQKEKIISISIGEMVHVNMTTFINLDGDLMRRVEHLLAPYLFETNNTINRQRILDTLRREFGNTVELVDSNDI